MKNIIVMFPYPSGAGLHIGHWYNYALMDSYCRWLRYKGEEVFQPFGYDAFGLPAENYAKKIGGDPREITYNSISNFRQELRRMNTLYEEKLITCEESYYKWTQWLFLKLKENGKAYKAYGEVNYCPECNTVLANEQCQNNHCERCDSLIIKKTLNQWYFKITDYKDRLIKNLDVIDFPEGTIKQQRRWLNNLRDWCISRQRKWGCPIPGEEDTLDTFVDSSFYFLRYLMSENSKNFFDKEKWIPVDLYVGGSEHACMHLIYARFIHMFLYDLGLVPEEEPFRKVFHQGMITSKGHKMGKSKGNAVDPSIYDPDVLRMYLMFIGPYDIGGDWNDSAVVGIEKFLKRLKVWLAKTTDNGENIELSSLEEDINNYVMKFKFNKVISSFMIFYNENKNKIPSKSFKERFLSIITNFAPSFKEII